MDMQPYQQELMDYINGHLPNKPDNSTAIEPIIDFLLYSENKIMLYVIPSLEQKNTLIKQIIEHLNKLTISNNFFASTSRSTIVCNGNQVIFKTTNKLSSIANQQYQQIIIDEYAKDR